MVISKSKSIVAWARRQERMQSEGMCIESMYEVNATPDSGPTG